MGKCVLYCPVGVDAFRLLQGCRSGKALAACVDDRKRLFQDLRAWAIPAAAWPTDLRLSWQLYEQALIHQGNLSYQLTWVPAAVESAVCCVNSADELPLIIVITPGKGQFDVRLLGDDIAQGFVEQMKVHKEGLHHGAFDKIVQEVEMRLHLPCGGNTNTSSACRLVVSPHAKALFM